MAYLINAVALVLLLAAGVFLGELLAKQPTRQVLTEAGSAAKFPPLELLLWLSPPLLLLLIHALLSSRGASLGSILTRRAAAD
jgi:hypothetical protein